MARFIYGDRRTEYVEVDLTDIQLIQNEEGNITYKPSREKMEARLYIPLLAKPFKELVKQIPGFEYEVLLPIAKVVDNEAYIEIDYIRDGCLDTLEWGNIYTKAEYEHVSSFIRKCIAHTQHEDFSYCESFEEYVKFIIIFNLRYENDIFSPEVASLLADKMLDRVLQTLDGGRIFSDELHPKQLIEAANEVLLELLKNDRK